MQSYELTYNPLDIICREGDPSSDLFYLKSGKLLICTVHGTEVKALARIFPGEFIGELSFFDGRLRASHIVALEKSVLIQLPKQELTSHLPFWFIEAGKSLTKKIRQLDQIIQESHFKRASSHDQKPLTIEEQREILSRITQQDT